MMKIIEMTFERRNEIDTLLNDLKNNVNVVDCIQTAVADGNSEMYDALAGALNLVTINLYQIYDKLTVATGIYDKAKSTETVPEKSNLEVYPLK